MLSTAHPLVSNWSTIVRRFICKELKNNKFGSSDRTGVALVWHTNGYGTVTHIYAVINYAIIGTDNVNTKLWS